MFIAEMSISRLILSSQKSWTSMSVLSMHNLGAEQLYEKDFKRAIVTHVQLLTFAVNLVLDVFVL